MTGGGDATMETDEVMNLFQSFNLRKRNLEEQYNEENYPARRACALRALGLLLADGAPTVGRGKTF